MRMFRTNRISLWPFIGFTVVLLWQGCSGDRYKTVVDAAGAGLSSLTLADDYRHQRRIQEVLVAEPEFAGLVLTAYVFMDHGYVVGHVHSPEQAEAVYKTARKVEGLRSLNAFLPAKHPSTVDTSWKGLIGCRIEGASRGGACTHSWCGGHACARRNPGRSCDFARCRVRERRKDTCGTCRGIHPRRQAHHQLVVVAGNRVFGDPVTGVLETRGHGEDRVPQRSSAAVAFAPGGRLRRRLPGGDPRSHTRADRHAHAADHVIDVQHAARA